jgi:cell division protein ZapA
METDNLKTIQVMVAGRSYPVRVKEEEEASIRDIEKKVNLKIKQFQQQYDKLDRTDCISMSLLTYAFELYKSKKTAQDKQLIEKIDDLDKLLENVLI